jgi:hypothetical protein
MTIVVTPATTLVSIQSIINSVSEILQDTSNFTWSVTQLIDWLNDAIRTLILVRPDTSSVTDTILLAPGTKQTLSDANDLRLIRVTRNMGADGVTPGRAIRLGNIDAMDAFNPDWHTTTADVVVKEYMYDEDRPKEFFVHPPVHASTPVYVEAMKSVLPETLITIGDTLPVDNVYSTALIEWMLYRAFSRDSERTPNWQRAARHYASFFNLLQVKQVADMAISPKIMALNE